MPMLSTSAIPRFTFAVLLLLLLSLSSSSSAMAQSPTDKNSRNPNNPSTTDEPLQLPPPSSDQHARTKLDLSSGSADLTDELGPLVINKDGTTARITNWAAMTSLERERTLRVLSKRNRERLAKLKAQLANSEDKPDL